MQPMRGAPRGRRHAPDALGNDETTSLLLFLLEFGRSAAHAVAGMVPRLDSGDLLNQSEVSCDGRAKSVRALEQRLQRVEGLLVELVDRLGAISPEFRRGPIADPAATDLVRRRPVGDPPAADSVRQRIAEIAQVNPGWISDPPPEDFLNVRILDLIRRYRGGFTDPAPDDLGNVRLRDLLSRVPGGGFTDPGPDDLKRLTTVELETVIHRINGEMGRLKSLSERLSISVFRNSENNVEP